jgi:hypothetical protein
MLASSRLVILCDCSRRSRDLVSGVRSTPTNVTYPSVPLSICSFDVSHHIVFCILIHSPSHALLIARVFVSGIRSYCSPRCLTDKQGFCRSRVPNWLAYVQDDLTPIFPSIHYKNYSGSSKVCSHLEVRRVNPSMTFDTIICFSLDVVTNPDGNHTVSSTANNEHHIYASD